MFFRNKIDVVSERQVSTLEGIALAKKWDIPFFEASAKNRINIDEQWIKLVHEVMAFRSVRENYYNKPSNKKKPKKCHIM